MLLLLHHHSWLKKTTLGRQGAGALYMQRTEQLNQP
jgi:hypothetical protein